MSSDVSEEKRSGRGRALVIGVVVLAAIVAARYFFPVPLPHIQMPAEVLFVVPGINFGFTNTMLAILTTDLLLLAIAFRVRSTLALKPKGLANVIEMVIEFWQHQAVQMVGTDLANRWLPLVLTVFLLVGLANWSELIPGYDTIGMACQECPEIQGGPDIQHTLFVGQDSAGVFLANERLSTAVEEGLPGEQNVPAVTEAGEAGPVEQAAEEHHVVVPGAYAVVPFYRAAATDMNFTVALALIAFFVIQYAGFKALGASYLTKFFNFKGGGLGIFVGLVELISELSRIISFSFRLFGNIFAGQILLFVIPFLLPFLVPVPIYGLETFVGLIQGYVFAILILAFMGAAVTAHEGGEHH